MLAFGCCLEPTYYAVLLKVKNDTLPRSTVTAGSFPTLWFECVKEPGLLSEKTIFFFFFFSASQYGAASGRTTSLYPANEKRHACETLKVDINVEGRVCVCMGVVLVLVCFSF